MKTKLKDVVNFIWGCDWIVTGSTIYYDNCKESMGHSLQSKGDIIKINILTATFLLRYGTSSNGISWIDYLLKNAKPVLRPLSDMTEMEIVFLLNMVYKNIYGYGADIQECGMFSENDDAVGYKCVDRLNDDEIGFTIEIERGVEYSTNGIHSIVNQFEITKELLRMGFDIFGLIKSKQAVNKTKIKSQPNNE